MTAERLRAAQKTAEAHSRIDSDVRQVYLLESSDAEEDTSDEPIKLLEVVDGAFEAGVEPIGFPPNAGRGVDHWTLIVEVSPREFETLGGTIQFQDKTWRVGRALLPLTVEA